MPEQAAFTAEERAELERLRAEVASLRAQVQAGRGVPGNGASRPGHLGRQRWRTVVASLLIVLACLLAPLSLAAVWTRNQVTDTDRYVATVSPLARDPAIQAAIADQITAQVFTYIDVQGLTTQAVEALAEQGLPPELASRLQAFAGPIATGVRSFTRDQVGRVVASDAFADAWVQANRVAHAELVAALTGEGGGAVTVENDTVSLNLAAFVQTVKARLVEAGFSVAARIPEVQASFVLFQSDDITRARSAFNLLNTLGVWLPAVALVLLVLGVYVAKDHRRALVGAAVVVAAGAFLSGQSTTAVRTRHGLTRTIAWLQGSAEQAGFQTGPVGTWVDANKRTLRVAAVTLAALALVFWDRPTGKVVLGLALALLVVLAVIEFLARPGHRASAVPTSHT